MSITYTGTGGGVPRKTAKIFAKNAASGDMTVFGSTLAGNTTYTQDLDSIQSAHYEVGWREAVISDLNYPLMSDMNAVQKTLSQQIAYGLQHGIPEWDAGTTYYAYDIVQSGGILYTSLIDENTNNVVTDSTKWAVYYNPNAYLNKTQVTNCIIEAPNGVANCINNYTTFIVYSGLKILIANGRNADGTMKNIEYTVPSDLTYNVVYGFKSGMIIIDNNGVIGTIANAKYIYSEATPSSPDTNDIWYNPITNLIKIYTNSEWVQTYKIPVAYFSTSANPNALLWFKSLRAIRIYTHNDDSELSGISFPSIYRRIELTLQTSRSLYTAPANGWVFVNGAAAASGIPYIYIYDEEQGLGTCSSGTTGVAQSTFMPVRKGEKFMVIYGNVTITYIGFSFAEGEI